MSALTPFNEATTSNELSVFKDPFQQNCIDEITISYRRPIFATSHVWSARVDFKNGLTTGTQRTPECTNWDDLMTQMKQIYQSLNVKPE